MSATTANTEPEPPPSTLCPTLWNFHQNHPDEGITPARPARCAVAQADERRWLRAETEDTRYDPRHEPLAPPIGGRTTIGSVKLDRRRRVIAIVAALCLVVVLPVGGYSAYVSYISFGCPPVWWADQLASDLAEIVPEGNPARAGIADCDGGREVGIGFSDPGENTTEVFRSVLTRAGKQGWTQVDGEPWWGCWTKRVAGVPATFRLRFVKQGSVPPDIGEQRYSISGTTAGGYCNGGKWTDEDPANAGY